LHGVLDGSKENSILKSIANLQCLGVFDHGVSEVVVDIFVDIDTLDAQTDLLFFLVAAW
jgi:hypothetical protein